MSDDVIVPLTEDETTVLMIAAQGESMMAIGRWEEPVKELTKRGFLTAADSFNYYITDAGRAAVNAETADADRAVDQALTKVVERVADSNRMRQVIADGVENLAQVFAELMAKAGRSSGESPVMLANQWGQVLVKRAAEIASGQ